MPDNDYLKLLDHYYPKLEYVKLIKPKATLFHKLDIFFQKNSHLQSLYIDNRFLLSISETIINSYMKLNVLSIMYREIAPEDLDQFCALLNKLHVNGFYKRLDIGSKSPCVSTSEMQKIRTLPGLEKLFGDFQLITFSQIVGLKDLHIQNEIWPESELENITNSFPNLRRVCLGSTVPRHLLPFIRRLPNLNEIFYIRLSAYVTNAPDFNLPELQKEREKLPGACKVTIYAEEHRYLASKMETKTMYSNYSLIEVKSIEKKISNILRLTSKIFITMP